MESEDGVGVLGVSGQGHLEVRVHAEVESCCHVTEANLLFPPDDVTLDWNDNEHAVVLIPPYRRLLEIKPLIT